VSDTDLGATAALLKREHPDATRFDDTEFLAWHYHGNPHHPAIEENVDRKGERVAHLALVPQPWRDHERSATFVLSVNAVTRSGLGSMHFVALAARGTRRAIERKDELGGLIGGIGVTNESSTMPGLHRIGARLITSLPVRAVPRLGRRPRGVESHDLDDAFRASADFTRLITGLDETPADGWTQRWTPEHLRWRLAAPGAGYAIHASEEVVAISTTATAKGVPLTVILKLLPRAGRRGPLPARSVISAAAHHHGVRAAIYAGFNAHVTVRGVLVPKRAQPAPLNLLFIARDEASQFLGMDLEDEGPQAPATFDTYELLDFDAF
jgi:hypothetical protein